MGRPTKLTPELKDKARDYLQNYKDYGDVIPSIEGLAVEIGVARSKVYKYRDKDEEFGDIVESILAKQARVLASKGLTSEFNSSITKLLLTKHGYSDKQETDITSKGNEIRPILGGLSNEGDSGLQSNNSD